MRTKPGAIAAGLPGLATLAALLTLCAVLAHWTWALLAPRPTGGGAGDAPMVMSKVLAGQTAERHLFGRSAEPTVPGVAAVAAAPGNFELHGVYAQRGGIGGFAIIAVDGKSQPVLAGATIAPGATLERVMPDHVMIRRGAVLEKLSLAGALGGPQAAAAYNAPAGAGLTVHTLGEEQYGLSRSELSSLLGDKARLNEMGRFAPHPQGGALLEQSPPGGLPEKLGLRVGDVLLGINDRSMHSGIDAGGIYNFFVTGARVRLDVQREGVKMTKTIQVYP